MSNTIETYPCQIYLLTPPNIVNLRDFAAAFEAAIAAAPVACLQIRLKDAARDHIIETAKTLIPIARVHNTVVLINDDPHIAAECGADGVHLGQMDMDINSAKELLSKDAVIGITCHNSKDLAFKAAENGADYVAFGAFFESGTKPAASSADLEILEWWHQAIEIPCVAIGGITVENAQQVIAAGADYIAVSGGVWDYPDGPGQAVLKLSELCTQHSPRPA